MRTTLPSFLRKRGPVARAAGVLTLAWLLGTAQAGDVSNRFERAAVTADQLIQLTGRGASNSVLRLEMSTNLSRWTQRALLIPSGDSFSYQEMGLESAPTRFYRFATSPATATNDWKNQTEFPGDAFLATDGGAANAVRWVKFIILAAEPERVYFQDSTKYVLHYDFARAYFPAFSGMSRTEFDAVTLHRTNQQAVIGTVLYPPRTNVAELAIQFAGQEPYPPEWIERYYRLVRTAIAAPAGAPAFYFPAFEQTEAARSAEAYFTQRGIRLGSSLRWIEGDQVYAAGWALGRLRYVTATNIAAAYATGQLRPGDILLTDGVPAEVPFVAGLVSLAPATPNSHAALFAAAARIPFGYVAAPDAQTRLRGLEGQEIILRCSVRYGFSEITVAGIEGRIDAQARAQLLQMKQMPPAQITPLAVCGAFSAAVETLTLADRQYFGGKAVNYGLLRRLAPSHSEPAVAFSFDLWTAFMSQPMPGGKTLGQNIAERLAPFTQYPPDVAAVEQALAAIRHQITKEAAFSPAQRQIVTNALDVFDPRRPLRFRSSSNAEDSKSFVGAGLYDSFSGCLLDDLDGDDAGPCQCDPSEPGERGVFRAIQKVYASFYNDNAFLERLRHGIRESQVGMALLAHYSAPDETEMANGVATLTREKSGWFGPPTLKGTWVTQAGATPVTNPDGNGRPEVVVMSEGGQPEITQRSSLVPLGESVLTWTSDYEALFGLMSPVYTAYCAAAGYTNATDAPLLDFEYKKIKPGKLMLKQVRELPQVGSETTDPFLVNQPATFWVFNSEQSNPLADHRLKCLLTLETANLRLTGTNLDTCFYTQARLEFRLGDEVSVLTGSPATWPGARHAVVADPDHGRVVRDSWTVGTGTGQCAYALITSIPTVSATDGLVMTGRELKKWLEVTYAQPQPALNGKVSSETVQLVASPDLASLAPQETTVYPAGPYTVSIAFLASTNLSAEPLPGVDVNAWGSFPAYDPSWAHATLKGVLAEPIQLRGYYATTGVLGHKTRYEWHVFEPAMDPDLPASQREALRAANLRLIHIERMPYDNKTTISILGWDGQWRHP